MRDNGLPGDDYVAVAELHPRLAGAALDLLRDAGFAAYADAGPGERDDVLPDALPDTLPGAATAGPSERLFVARVSAEAARALLQERLPRMRHEAVADGSTTSTGPSSPTVAPSPTSASNPTLPTDADPVARPGREAAEDGAAERGESTDALEDTAPAGNVDEDVWAGIVAAFRAPAADMSARVLPPQPAGPPAASEPRPDGSYEFAAASPVADYDDHVEHFEPEPPPPLPRITLVTGVAGAAVLLMPVLFLLALWLHIDVTGWTGLFGVAAFVGGFLVLISRLGDGPPEGWDDGAVV